MVFSMAPTVPPPSCVAKIATFCLSPVRRQYTFRCYGSADAAGAWLSGGGREGPRCERAIEPRWRPLPERGQASQKNGILACHEVGDSVSVCRKRKWREAGALSLRAAGKGRADIRFPSVARLPLACARRASGERLPGSAGSLLVLAAKQEVESVVRVERTRPS